MTRVADSARRFGDSTVSRLDDIAGTARLDGSTGRRRADLPLAEQEMDVHLRRMLRRTSVMRQGFYLVVLVVALAGQVSGAVEALGIPLAAAVPAVGALELGGVVVLANADVRRRLGERAVASRLLSVAIAAAAVAFNWLAHANHLLGGFFAGMSALGYLVWLMHTENQRRDRLRAKGDLPPTTPAYEVVDHWLRHPWLTHRAKSMAKAHPGLGLYDSLAAARAEVRRERRQAAISKVLHRKIRAAVDPNTADIAVAVYDLDEIATRLADGADYDGLTALIAADLAPARLGLDTSTTAPVPAATAPAGAPAPAADTTPANGPEAPGPDPAPDTPTGTVDGTAAGRTQTGGVVDSPTVESPMVPRPVRASGRAQPVRVFDPSERQHLDDLLGRPAEPASATPGDEPARRDRSRRSTAGQRAAAPAPAVPAPRTGPLSDTLPATAPSPEGSLRTRVHSALDEHVPAGDRRDESTLVELVSEVLDLNDIDRLTAATYVHSWSQEGSRVAVPAGGAG